MTILTRFRKVLHIFHINLSLWRRFATFQQIKNQNNKRATPKLFTIHVFHRGEEKRSCCMCVWFLFMLHSLKSLTTSFLLLLWNKIWTGWFSVSFLFYISNRAQSSFTRIFDDSWAHSCWLLEMLIKCNFLAEISFCHVVVDFWLVFASYDKTKMIILSN